MQELAKEDNHELEAALGFPLFTDGDSRMGWLMNLNAVSPTPLNHLPCQKSMHRYTHSLSVVLFIPGIPHNSLSRRRAAWPGAGGKG